jgi:hypothetical protein
MWTLSVHFPGSFHVLRCYDHWERVDGLSNCSVARYTSIMTFHTGTLLKSGNWDRSQSVNQVQFSNCQHLLTKMLTVLPAHLRYSGFFSRTELRKRESREEVKAKPKVVDENFEEDIWKSDGTLENVPPFPFGDDRSPSASSRVRQSHHPIPLFSPSCHQMTNP